MQVNRTMETQTVNQQCSTLSDLVEYDLTEIIVTASMLDDSIMDE